MLKMWWMRVVAPVAILCSLALSGCGEGGAGETGSVSGKVTFNGEAVGEGMVGLNDAVNGTGGGGKIAADGSYSASGLKPGEYKIAIEPPMTNMDSTDAENPPKPKDMPNIPQKYRSYETSGLSVTIKAGSNDFNIEMTGGGEGGGEGESESN